MNLYMPEIFWHDRKGILCIDVQQNNSEKIKLLKSKTFGLYKIATASIQKEIRIWEFHYDKLINEKELYQLSVDFVANILGHESTTNIVKFSPNGKYLASGDVDGALLVWKISAREDLVLSPEKEKDKALVDEFPPNKENWTRAFRVPIKHYGDVTYIAWSPDSTMIASVATDDTISVHKADSGKQLWTIRNFRHYANGIAWDPRGKYIVTVSTDRRLDILEASKGTRLRCCHKIELPEFVIGSSQNIIQQSYKIFHDDQLYSFMRGVEFSTCGSLVFAPAGHLEVEDQNIYGTFVFRRSEFDKCRPYAMVPSSKPTLSVKCSPIFYKLRSDVKENFLQLPYRLVFAVLCKESVFFYDSQFSTFFSYIDNFQFDHLTSMSWTPDGKVLVISSLEGYNTFITFNNDSIGEPCDDQDAVILLNCIKEAETPLEVDDDAAPIKSIEWPDSPRLIVPKKTPRPKKENIPIVSGDKTLNDNKTQQQAPSASTTPFVIIKRKKNDTSSITSPIIAKRRKDVEKISPKTPGQEKKVATEKQSLTVQKKINELW